jgi:hypothetical protein
VGELGDPEEGGADPTADVLVNSPVPRGQLMNSEYIIDEFNLSEGWK